MDIDLDALTAMAEMLDAVAGVTAPELGSPEWVALSLEDPRRQVAVVRAAFSWWAAGTGVAAPASAEAIERVVANELKAASEAVSVAIPAQREARRQEALRGPCSAPLEYPAARR